MEVIKGRKKYWNIFLNWKKALVTINENTQKILIFFKKLKQKALNLFHGISFFVLFDVGPLQVKHLETTPSTAYGE